MHYFWQKSHEAEIPSGRLIAIMLGRLEMDVDECIAAYKTLMKTVFEKKRSLLSVGLTGNIKARFSSKALEKAIKSVIEARGMPVDAPFYVKVEDEQLRKCKVYGPRCFIHSFFPSN